MTPQRKITAQETVLPLAKAFTISRGAKDEARLVRVTISEGNAVGEGECCPYPRYGESVESVLFEIRNAASEIGAGVGRDGLQTLLSPGAARNALDCALWDLEAKTTGVSVAERIRLTIPEEFATLRTVVIAGPAAMADEAASYPKGVPLKVKLDQESALERLGAIHKAAPSSPIVVDANEGWTADFLARVMPALPGLCVVILEQPLKAGEDQALSEIEHTVPLFADEACHTRADLGELSSLYDGINLKLDKTGGLTEALALVDEAKWRGFKIMIGCMVSSSLSIAPIAHLCSDAEIVDLDGPLLLKPGLDEGMAEVAGTAFVKLNTRWGHP